MHSWQKTIIFAQNREKSYCYDGCVYEQGYYFDNKKIMDIKEKRERERAAGGVVEREEL